MIHKKGSWKFHRCNHNLITFCLFRKECCCICKLASATILILTMTVKFTSGCWNLHSVLLSNILLCLKHILNKFECMKFFEPLLKIVFCLRIGIVFNFTSWFFCLFIIVWYSQIEIGNTFQVHFLVVLQPLAKRPLRATCDAEKAISLHAVSHLCVQSAISACSQPSLRAVSHLCVQSAISACSQLSLR